MLVSSNDQDFCLRNLDTSRLVRLQIMNCIILPKLELHLVQINKRRMRQAFDEKYVFSGHFPSRLDPTDAQIIPPFAQLLHF